MLRILEDIWAEFIDLLREAAAATNRKTVLATLGTFALAGVSIWYSITHIDSRMALNGVVRMDCQGGEYSNAWIGGILVSFFAFSVSSAMFIGEVMVLNQKRRAGHPVSPWLAVALGVTVAGSFVLGMISALSC